MTKIEWTEATWNPIVGCSIVSPGCTNCYAMKMAARLEAMSIAHEARHGGDPGPLFYYRDLTQDTRAGAVWTGKVAIAPEDVLTKPLRWKKPRMIFVNSMSDLFHESVPNAWIDRVFAVMALTPQHTYQVLTKRSARMRDYMGTMAGDYMLRLPEAADVVDRDLWPAHVAHMQWPLPNVWLGVSAERQQEADARIPDLLATPAAIRFVSAEPLLGPVSFRCISGLSSIGVFSNRGFCDALTGETEHAELRSKPYAAPKLPRLDWIIVGGESGPGARPMHPDWARSIRDQCAAADVPFFFKQWGTWVGENQRIGGAHDRHTTPRHSWSQGGPLSFAVGKKRAGRLLDGREHSEWPRTEGRP